MEKYCFHYRIKNTIFFLDSQKKKKTQKKAQIFFSSVDSYLLHVVCGFESIKPKFFLYFLEKHQCPDLFKYLYLDTFKSILKVGTYYLDTFFRRVSEK